MRVHRWVLAVTIALTICTFSPSASFAQGQEGAMQDMINLYQQMLSDPDIDAATRQELSQMIRTLQQEQQDMSSALPSSGNSGYAPPTQYYDPEGAASASDDEEAERPWCYGDPACAASAQ